MIAGKSMVEAMFAAVGDRLRARGATASVVVLGGAALNLLGFVDRATRDVDVLARTDEATGHLRHPEPLPAALRPTPRELSEAAAWIRTQDASPDFHVVVERVVAYVQDHSR
jgi:hypothetical protein